eukprot:7742977-Prorocentrum_lima.AAC.1
MTSSLVGSEMCIRDSMHTRRDAVPEQYRCAVLQDLGTEKRQCGRTLCLPCLLYTSDAADDM